MDTPMTLSAAMREGSLQHGQNRDSIASYPFDNPTTLQTSAMGAALVGRWGLERMIRWKFSLPIADEWHWIFRQLTRCPERKTQEGIGNIIHHLNHDAGWTRNQIADWLETLGY